MAEEKIKKRSDIPEEYTWNLKDIFESDEAWLSELETLKTYGERVAAFSGRLSGSASELLAFFRLNDELDIRLGKLLGYASQKSDEDTGSAKAAAAAIPV